MHAIEGEHRSGQRRRSSFDGVTDQVTQRRTHIDAHELIGVADEHHPGIGSDRVEEPPQQGQVDHGALVDDDQVVGQGVRSIVAEPPVGQPAEQSVQRRRLRWVVEHAGHRVGESRGGFARRRCERDSGPGVPRGRLLPDRPQQLRDRPGLAGPGSAEQEGDGALGGGADRRALRVGGQWVDAGIDVGDTRRGHGTARAVEHVVQHRVLVVAVALEVEAIAVQHERPKAVGVQRPVSQSAAHRDERARPERRAQCGRVELGQRGALVAARSTCRRDEHADVVEQDADVPQASTERGQRRADHDLAGDRIAGGCVADQRVDDVDLGRVQHAGLHVRFERGDRDGNERVRGAHHRPANRSLRAPTSAGGIAQRHTPSGPASRTRVSGPAMPRTNR